jgi:uncharacterized membrane protein
MGEANSQANYAYQMVKFVKNHQLSIGLLLTIFGVADLWFIMPNIWSSAANWQGFYLLMPQWSVTVPILFIISLIGTVILCVYSIRDIQLERTDNKERAAILVTALGFTYQVIGAWPLWNQPYPWPWQKEIANYGNLLVLPLFIGSLLALIIGAASLYIHSKINHKKHPEP